MYKVRNGYGICKDLLAVSLLRSGRALRCIFPEGRMPLRSLTGARKGGCLAEVISPHSFYFFIVKLRTVNAIPWIRPFGSTWCQYIPSIPIPVRICQPVPVQF